MGEDDAASIWAWTVELKVPDMPESLLINRVSWRPDGTRTRDREKTYVNLAENASAG